MSRGWCDCTGGDRDTVGLRAADYSEIGPSVRRILVASRVVSCQDPGPGSWHETRSPSHD